MADNPVASSQGRFESREDLSEERSYVTVCPPTPPPWRENRSVAVASNGSRKPPLQRGFGRLVTFRIPNTKGTRPDLGPVKRDHLVCLDVTGVTHNPIESLAVNPIRRTTIFEKQVKLSGGDREHRSAMCFFVRKWKTGLPAECWCDGSGCFAPRDLAGPDITHGKGEKRAGRGKTKNPFALV